MHKHIPLYVRNKNKLIGHNILYLLEKHTKAPGRACLPQLPFRMLLLFIGIHVFVGEVISLFE